MWSFPEFPVYVMWKPLLWATAVLSLSPWPIKAPCRASLAEPKPSSLHTTLAAGLSHMWSTMVPHFPSRSTSTRPSPSLGPAFRRTGCAGQRWKYNSVYAYVQFINTMYDCASVGVTVFILPQLDRGLGVFLRRCEQTEVLAHTWPLHVSHSYKEWDYGGLTA